HFLAEWHQFSFGIIQHVLHYFGKTQDTIRCIGGRRESEAIKIIQCIKQEMWLYLRFQQIDLRYHSLFFGFLLLKFVGLKFTEDVNNKSQRRNGYEIK